MKLNNCLAVLVMLKISHYSLINSSKSRLKKLIKCSENYRNEIDNSNAKTYNHKRPI